MVECTCIQPQETVAEAAFQRDLPQLLNEHPRQWVAYHGSRQLGTAAARDSLHSECLDRGVSPEELVVWRIEPVIGEMSVSQSALDLLK
jgi:hypothetical protein